MSKKIQIWPLDVSYTIIKGVPYIEIWGIDSENNRVILLDGSFRPYFYVTLIDEDSEKIETLRIAIKRISGIMDVELIKRKWFGKLTKVLKVQCELPTQVPSLRDKVRRLPNVKDVLEADIRFYMRYMIDKNIYPCTWYEVEAIEISGEEWNKYLVDKRYVVKGDLVKVDKEDIPNLRILAFDIETYNPKGSPDSKIDPIIIISVATSDKKTNLFVAGKDKNDAEIIKKFVDFVKKYDPDIIFGYNSNRFDWIYLMDRARINGIKLNVDRKNNVPHPSVYGHQSVAGRANIDLMDYAEILYEVKVKTLKNVAEYLGVLPKSKRVMLEYEDIVKYWDNDNLRQTLLDYALDDVKSTYGIGEIVLPFAIELSRLVGLTLDQVLAASVGFRVEWYLMRFAFNENELVPSRIERRHETYVGALVFTPKQGIFKNVAYMDFAAMYPSLIIKYNIGPDTFVPSSVQVSEENVNISPVKKYRFLKAPDGLYKKSLQILLETRKKIKSQLKELDPKSPQYRILDSRQKAIKVIANATYGYAGWSGARWYKKEVAEATTEWGRETILATKKIAEEMGLPVYYGDTDSLFIKYEKEKIEKFVERVEREIGLEIKPDRIYKVILFTGAKKRYAGIDEKGFLDVTGFEVVRGDWAGIAREVQENVLRHVLEEGKPDNALNYIKKVIKELKEQKIPFEKLIIWKTITKELDEYKVKTAQLTAAKILKEHEYEIKPGMQIGFVIVKGPGSISDRAMPYQLASYEDIDIEYYIDNQIIPVAVRILSTFGITESDIKTGKRQVSLTDFF